MFDNIDEIKAHINVSKQLDIKTLKPYIEQALSDKILPFVGKEILSLLTDDKQAPSVWERIKRATANYAVALSIPFLKMHLSNTGTNTFSDGKTERSPWWDIRDYGLNAIAIGDRALNDAVFELQQSELKDKLPIYNEIQRTLFASPFEFSKIYPIGDSYEVFLKLIPLMDDVWHLYLANQLPNCTLENLKTNEKALFFLKKITAYYTLADAILTAGLTFTKSAIVIQWEQLPWQKSQLLEQNDLLHLRAEFLSKAKQYTESLLTLLKNSPDEFPCFAKTEIEPRAVIAKKSGLYF
ncbi:DUF6712 family protein [Capnocytophaga sp.]|uniref:DUF6712 family protein n=1 Tax=Capnocytophaga sp. TaxID=44737 RepID=UPI0026DD13DA|nr:DUF6712 family protein [Capnocytophaga sp.]MDO5104461.1 hypothetical protein [Capnocytophaga sp.]